MPDRRPTRLAQSLRNNATPAERVLWGSLRNSQLEGQKLARQMPIGPFVCDFLCREARLAIELDGGQHGRSASDASHTAYLENEGYRVVRFWNNEVLENIDGVLVAILSHFGREPPPHPRPLPLAGGGIQT
jgi:very-short-patch-repair endonuclease